MTTQTMRRIDNVTSVGLSGTTLASTIPGEERIAHLTDREIMQMNRAQLVGTIRAARQSVLREDANRMLPRYDRETLERLVFLTRRCCHDCCGGGIP